MDYGEIDRQKGAAPDRLLSELSLDLYEVTVDEVLRLSAGFMTETPLLISLRTMFRTGGKSRRE